MGDCGADHGKVCADLATHKEEIAKVWDVMKTRLSTKVFIWACSATAVVLSFIIGLTQNNHTTINTIQAQQAVTIERIDHNREVVSGQYTALKESIKDLKRSLKRESDD